MEQLRALRVVFHESSETIYCGWSLRWVQIEHTGQQSHHGFVKDLSQIKLMVTLLILFESRQVE